jgi:hypothetical protein
MQQREPDGARFLRVQLVEQQLGVVRVVGVLRVLGIQQQLGIVGVQRVQHQLGVVGILRVFRVQLLRKHVDGLWNGLTDFVSRAPGAGYRPVGGSGTRCPSLRCDDDEPARQ